MASTKILTRERTDLLQTLAKHRYFLRFTVRDLTDEQAAERSTASALCLGGLIKHVAAVERGWLEFALWGQAAMPAAEDVDYAAREAEFRLLPGETLAGVLADYDEVAARTSEIIATVPDLGAAHPLPAAPWFEPGASWSIRRVLLHVIAETAQHAGHADILREAIDGARTMG
jgi:uncharacterized damage-inducible protein DinB